MSRRIPVTGMSENQLRHERWRLELALREERERTAALRKRNLEIEKKLDAFCETPPAPRFEPSERLKRDRAEDAIEVLEKALKAERREVRQLRSRLKRATAEAAEVHNLKAKVDALERYRPEPASPTERELMETQARRENARRDLGIKGHGYGRTMRGPDLDKSRDLDGWGGPT